MLRACFFLLAGAVLLMLGLSACAEEPSAESRAAADSIAAQPGTLSVARTDTVRVVLSEFSIKMPASLRAGRTVFRVRNAGKRMHNFELERGDTEEAFESNLRPGATDALEVTLRPGTYEVYCPVDDHEARGMEMRLTVEGSDTSE